MPSGLGLANTHTHTQPCPAAREPCFGKQAWMLSGLQSQTEHPLGLQQLCTACLHVTATRKNKVSCRHFTLFDCHHFYFSWLSPEWADLIWDLDLKVREATRQIATSAIHCPSLPLHVPFSHPWRGSLASCPHWSAHPPPQFPGQGCSGTGLEGWRADVGGQRWLWAIQTVLAGVLKGLEMEGWDYCWLTSNAAAHMTACWATSRCCDALKRHGKVEWLLGNVTQTYTVFLRSLFFFFVCVEMCLHIPQIKNNLLNIQRYNYCMNPDVAYQADSISFSYCSTHEDKAIADSHQVFFPA